MEAIAVRREGGNATVERIEKPRPEPSTGEALVRTLRVGVDGTDHEVIEGVHGELPEGEDHLVLGHEAVGVVADANGTDLEEGDLVVPTVRRPPNGTNDYFERGEPDMAPEGQYVERGIVGAHGFMAEYFTSPVEYLVTLPPELAEWGFLVEPLSITEKAVEHAEAARSAFDWQPESALVLGNGSLGLITLAAFEREYERTYCLGRRERPDPTIDIIEWLGSTYVNSTETPVSEIPAAYEPMDLIYEATGYAPHAFETIEALAPNGVGALVGVPEDWSFEIDGGKLHREFVLHNKALVGSVNSHAGHFEAAIDTLAGLEEAFLDRLVTGVYGLDKYESAFADDDTTIKTAVEFASYEER
ncbi:Threonine dehydrogenase or related Zn-dependent dehydrogenase [Halalkaliarchaeum sp. AArc-CO]|uniref:glucose 1-dehydrogenase n=1 Tax=unclassified Halalkaliarchaeum TaxID=2678344 RepID=UPI00217DF2EB|nr:MULTISPECIES: glucose 1-dehydrogenase [unclassified Halalkaliarchaeum]MDR5671850.1 glucose 1-dehydrogenase [Halalkaliarchaeum sp. AArc-GB]UWG51353.1 Threonine dehydrogenase or related Zn-dependent dehydrogenase [Halalkaliarchaeum sp. AArc-CO]